MAAILPTNLDYSTKDFSSIRRRVIALVRTVFPEWTSEDLISFENLLVESFAWVADLLIFYQDKQAAESRWSTAQLRKNIIALCKLIGFTPRGAQAATTVVTFTLAAAAAHDVTIEKGRKVRTEKVLDSVAFQLLEDLVIPAGTTVATATVEHSEFQENTFESNGTAGQRFTLASTPFLDGSAVVTASNGTFDPVDNFVSSSGTDRHYTLSVNENNVATVVFGDGRNGRIPLGTITVAYKTGGGEAGRLEANSLRRLDGIVQDAAGNVVRVTVTNASATVGGAARQGVEQIRQLAPLSLRTLTRAVARDDFENGALQVAGVARALHLTKNEDGSVGENAGVLYVVPDDYGTASADLLTEVKAQFFQIAGYPDPPLPALSTYQLLVVSAVYLAVDFQVKVFKRKGRTGAQVKAAILAAIAGYFRLYNTDGSKNTLIDFGYYIQDVDGEPAGSIPFSDMFNLIRDVDGVARIGDGSADFLVNGLRKDVTISARAFPKAGTVVIVDGDTGLTL
jgi:hypothetical protein